MAHPMGGLKEGVTKVPSRMGTFLQAISSTQVHSRGSWDLFLLRICTKFEEVAVEITNPR